MKLSNILNKMDLGISYTIEKEEDFDTMGLAVSNNDLSMCTFIDDEKYLNTIPKNVSMIIIAKELSNKVDSYGLCITDKPRELFFTIHNYLQNDAKYCREKFLTNIGDNCKIKKHANIAKYNVKIGNNVVIEEFVSIKENTEIGDNTIIRAGSIIGGEGFQFNRLLDPIGSVKHLGGVKICKNVEIQYNVCIDKAIYPWDDTIIGESTKIDNLCHIAHAVKIKNNVLIAANANIAGRTVIGSNTWVGPNVMISNGLTIDEDCHIGLGSVVVSNLSKGIKVFGNPARIYDKNK